MSAAPTPREAADYLSPLDRSQGRLSDHEKRALRVLIDDARATPAEVGALAAIASTLDGIADNHEDEAPALTALANLIRAHRCATTHQPKEQPPMTTQDDQARVTSTPSDAPSADGDRPLCMDPECECVDYCRVIGDRLTTPDPAPQRSAENAFRDAVIDLLRRVGRMRDDWAESDKANQNALWRSVHTAAEHVGAILDAEDARPWADELARLATPAPAPPRDDRGSRDGR